LRRLSDLNVASVQRSDAGRRIRRDGRRQRAFQRLRNRCGGGAWWFQRTYGLETIGLRYFNVFGPRQDPEGQYAAVIPRWIASLMRGEPCRIFGDGETSRDFCHIANAVEANLLAATAPAQATETAYNVACNETTSLNELFVILRDAVARAHPEARDATAVHDSFRPGDIAHSRADIGKATRALGYERIHRVGEGLPLVVDWYIREYRKQAPSR